MIAPDAFISPPARLHPSHDLSFFDCGEPILNDWLRRRALRHDESGASRTYVACAGTCVIGYYALAVGAVAHESAPGRLKRNMPNPIPVMVLGRLAVDRQYRGQSLGSSLLRDAIIRTMQAAEIAGIRVIIVHAISDRAKAFYGKWGVVASEMDPMTLMISLREASGSLGA
jgi:GNAT superfamily N-acetyltransferase